MANKIIAEHWSAADLARLAGGVGPDGRRLPGSGSTAIFGTVFLSRTRTPARIH
jgi:hypothetical protein